MALTSHSFLGPSAVENYQDVRIDDEEDGLHVPYRDNHGYTPLLSSRITQAPKSDRTCSLHAYPPGQSRLDSYHVDGPGMEFNDNKSNRLEETLSGLRSYILFNLFRFGSLSGVFMRHHRDLTATSNLPKAIQLSRGPYTHRSVQHWAKTLLLATTAILVITPVLISGAVLLYGGLPPSYSNARLREKMLPQHRWNRDIQDRLGGFVKAGSMKTQGFIEGASGEDRYLRFPDHLWGHGLNNVLQEALLYGLLAHYSNRSYVFEDYVWSHLPLPYTLYDFTLRSTRVPLSAFLGGWLVGQDFLKSRDLPRIQLQQIERTTTDHKDTGERRQHGPLIERVRDLSRWARAQFVFRVEPQRPRIQKQEWQHWTSTLGYILSNPNESSPDRSFHLGNVNRRMASASLSPRDKATTLPRRASRSSISAEYFEHICPPSRQVEIVYDWPSNTLSDNADSRSGPLKEPPDAMADGIDILNWWLDRLEHEDVRHEPCVVIKEHERRVWDSNFFGSIRPHSLLPLLRESPVLTSFAWSDLVATAVDQIVATFFSYRHPSAPISNPQARIPNVPQPKDYTRLECVGGAFVDVDMCAERPRAISWDASAAPGDSSAYSDPRSAGCISGAHSNCQTSTGEFVAIDSTENGNFQGNIRSKVIPGVLAVHLRRGDYKRHCLRLAHWRAGYMAWNRLFEAPSNGVFPDAAHHSADTPEMSFENGLREHLKKHDDSKMPHYADGANGTNRSSSLASSVIDAEMTNQEHRTEIEAYYLAHCLPTISQIVKRLREVREEYEQSMTPMISTIARTDFVSPVSSVSSQQTAGGNTRNCSNLQTATVVAASAEYSRSHAFGLKQVYVLTNGWPSFVEELRVALLEDGWEKIVASTDIEHAGITDQDPQNSLAGYGTEGCCIESGRAPGTTDADAVIQLVGEEELCRCTGALGLSKEERGVSAAIDMGLAERAEVFVGNGFSSLSANIVMLRLAKGLGVHTNKML